MPFHVSPFHIAELPLSHIERSIAEGVREGVPPERAAEVVWLAIFDAALARVVALRAAYPGEPVFCN